MYDVILHDCVSKDVICSYLQSLYGLDALDELQCMYLHKVKECDCLAQKLSNQTESVSKEVHTELLKRFAKVEKYSIYFEINLQKCKEKVKNDTVWNEKASNVFRKEREQYIKIQDLKAQLQDKNIAISELKKLIKNGRGKSVETKFDKPFVVRQPNAQRIPKPSVLGKPVPFLNSLDRIYFQKTVSFPKANVSECLSKPVTAHTLPQTAKKVVLPNNSQVKLKKTQVEVHPRIPSVYNRMTSVTACKDSLNSRTLNDNAVCATCNKCLVDSNHFACVTKMLNDVHARTKKPTVLPISNRKPKSQANKSVATPNKKKVASKSTSQKPQSYIRMLYENTSKAWKWWIERQSPLGYKWVPKTKKQWVPKAKMQRIVQLILFIVDSGYTKHMIGNLKLLCNFVEKFLGLNHNIFSVGQFCDADLKVAFRKSTCFVRDLQGNDLLVGNRGSDLYMISLQESTSLTPFCLMAKATPTQAWLWHQRLSHLNFDYINLLLNKDIVIGLPKLKYVKDQLCSFCELSKPKRSSFKSKAVPSSKGRLNLLHIDLCGPMRVASINGKKYILVIVDDYSRYTWILFLRSKDETPEVLKDFLTMIQRNLQALVITVRTDRGTEFLNKTLNAFFKEEGIEDGEKLDKMKEKKDQCILVGYSTQSKGYRVYNKRTRMIVESIHIRFDEIKELSETQDVYSSADADAPSQQELDMLFGPLHDEFFNTGSNPSTNIQSTSAPSTHTNMHVEENNNDQAEEGEHVPDDEFTNPFCAPTQEVDDSSSHNIVQTRRQLATDPEMCMYALTVSTTEPKNIKEAMVDSVWIEAMQEELHQFDRLQV
nr:hypothetical protein [Tanacetum cinerariifolium]